MAKLWTKFGTSKYLSGNYSQVHDEDKQIIEICVKFLAKKKHVSHAMEVGTGPNLYPAILFAPHVSKLDLIEYSENNLDYLYKNIGDTGRDWHKYQVYMSKFDKEYKHDITKSIKRKSNIKKGSVYKLPANKYDLISMFFCAESITGHYPTFARACHSFLRSAKKGGLVIAAFMKQSKGYSVDGIRFPATQITARELETIFMPSMKEVAIVEISKSKHALRAGYEGMLLLVGEK